MNSALDDCPPVYGLSLCSGVGGLDLGLHLAVEGYSTVCYVEVETYCMAALQRRMENGEIPAAPLWDNLRTFDPAPWSGVVDIVSAGYPCQPFSAIGMRKGKDDPRHLWPEVRRIASGCAAPLVFLENVEGHLHIGMDIVARELAEMGYEIEAGLFSAEEVGAPHTRERVFILAALGEALADPCGGGLGRGKPEQGEADALQRLQQSWPPGPYDPVGWEVFLENRPHLEPAVLRGSDGLAERVDRIRAAGNGVVPLEAANAFCTLAGRLVERMGDGP